MMMSDISLLFLLLLVELTIENFNSISTSDIVNAGMVKFDRFFCFRYSSINF